METIKDHLLYAYLSDQRAVVLQTLDASFTSHDEVLWETLFIFYGRHWAASFFLSTR
jgi:hypothetical protein